MTAFHQRRALLNFQSKDKTDNMNLDMVFGTSVKLSKFAYIYIVIVFAVDYNT